jgi:hypothetical protein
MKMLSEAMRRLVRWLVWFARRWRATAKVTPVDVFILEGGMSVIRCRKAQNLTASQALTLINAFEEPESAKVLAMQPSDRDLQCLLDVHVALQSVGHDSLAVWFKRDMRGALSAVWKADQGQIKRGM